MVAQISVGKRGIAGSRTPAGVDSNDRVQIFDRSGVFLDEFGSQGGGDGQFNAPYGIAVDSQDRVIVSDVVDDRVQVFDSTGQYLFQFGSPGSGNGEFIDPSGVAVNSRDQIVVADTNNDRIQVFNKNGVFIRAFGSEGTGDGQMNNPIDVAVDKKDRSTQSKRWATASRCWLPATGAEASRTHPRRRSTLLAPDPSRSWRSRRAELASPRPRPNSSTGSRPGHPSLSWPHSKTPDESHATWPRSGKPLTTRLPNH